jgi:hypothetical protein
MTFRRDRVAGNIASLGNDIGDFVESGGHRCSQDRGQAADGPRKLQGRDG